MVGGYEDWVYDNLHDDEEAFMQYCKEHPWRLAHHKKEQEQVEV